MLRSEITAIAVIWQTVWQCEKNNQRKVNWRCGDKAGLLAPPRHVTGPLQHRFYKIISQLWRIDSPKILSFSSGQWHSCILFVCHYNRCLYLCRLLIKLSRIKSLLGTLPSQQVSRRGKMSFHILIIQDFSLWSLFVKSLPTPALLLQSSLSAAQLRVEIWVSICCHYSTKMVSLSCL